MADRKIEWQTKKESAINCNWIRKNWIMKQPFQKQLKNEDSDLFNVNLFPLSWAAVQERLQFVQHRRLRWQSSFDFLPNRRTRNCQNSFEAKRRCQDQRHCRKNTLASRIEKLKGIARYFFQKYLTSKNN